MNAPATARDNWRRASAAYEATEDIMSRVMALEAIEQLMTPWKAGTQEDLADVDRTSLAWLLAVVNVELRRCVTEATTLADTSQCELYAQAQKAEQP